MLNLSEHGHTKLTSVYVTNVAANLNYRGRVFTKIRIMEVAAIAERCV